MSSFRNADSCEENLLLRICAAESQGSWHILRDLRLRLGQRQEIDDRSLGLAECQLDGGNHQDDGPGKWRDPLPSESPAADGNSCV